ncbi:hypothetical protein JD844_030933 [Phrynosoma platyrhinos]|uniref:Putative treble-clef zinc-finger domain-containing protein n=1 Tax=Phrynosoma platyrhinos TaxID=52577 RepID=A0ABQ7SZY5_PHRPL|nr:hypothetical protein JD844_030933 [Phrynosoma platyrhinos]
MESSSIRNKVPAFLSDLGKATLRGIRKCPRCGTYNGTRGLSCKNKTCGTVFRYGTRKQTSIDAVKIITGSDLQVYSVRQRDRGPDSRCFVELGVSETTIQTVDGTILTQLSSGRCYVPSCLKATAQGVGENQCQHIKLAVNCQAEATPLTLKSSILNSMQAPPETKQTIWQLATEPTGPLVQRITKNIMVVKCKASQKHSLGYLHASFAHKASHRNVMEPRFSCSCQSLKSSKATPSKEEMGQKCLHFFACICAFTSDDALAQEFADFLTCYSDDLKPTIGAPPVCPPEAVLQSVDTAASKAKRRKKEETLGLQTNSPLLSQDLANSNLRKGGLKKPSVASLKRQVCSQGPDESQVTMSFQEWLASVTERIHQAMHYQFDAFVRKDALPLGTFSKYTWHITNILQVKQIFDTLQMPLEITRSFIQNRDGNTSPDQKEPTPFIIEWIPDILPYSKIGELRIKFEYGHYRNGHAMDGQEQRPSLEQTLELMPLTTITFP